MENAIDKDSILTVADKVELALLPIAQKLKVRCWNSAWHVRKHDDVIFTGLEARVCAQRTKQIDQRLFSVVIARPEK